MVAPERLTIPVPVIQRREEMTQVTSRQSPHHQTSSLPPSVISFVLSHEVENWKFIYLFTGRTALEELNNVLVKMDSDVKDGCLSSPEDDPL